MHDLMHKMKLKMCDTGVNFQLPSSVIFSRSVRPLRNCSDVSPIAGADLLISGERLNGMIGLSLSARKFCTIRVCLV